MASNDNGTSGYGDMANLRAITDEHEQTQKRTFTKWINYHLETHSSSGLVRDLYEDLKDGVLLCYLIEVLTGDALQVNKAKVSKRVHHISNLTIALTALRRRGLDLVNNNPSDIADGNPRIVLGLIWQMILHFQIENNFQLLKEWGYELEGVSPSTSKVSNETPVSPFSRISQRLKIGRLKAPVERVVLRWLSSQLSEPYGVVLADMDNSWKNGIAFNALIHRIRPELVDMEQVRKNSPKENLEQAFRLAKEHLCIRPLLDVEDMLCDKPDKRSVITYVSQFIRLPPLIKPIAAGPLIGDHALVVWMEATLNTLRSILSAPLFDQYQTYLSLRKEYFERRNAYYQLREHADDLPGGEWNRIETCWKRIGDALNQWNNGLEEGLPGDLSKLANWLCTAEQIIKDPIDLRLDDAQQTLMTINEAISQHKIHFLELPVRSERFQSIYVSRQVEGREISSDLLDRLKIRLDTVAREAAFRLKSLHRMQAHYMLLANIEVLDEKMQIWRSGDSTAAVRKSIEEYKLESDAAPAKKFKRLLANLKDLFSEEDDSLITLKQCYDSVAETIKKFTEMRAQLESLLAAWRKFEKNADKLEEKIERSEREKRNFPEADQGDLQSCENAYDCIKRFASTHGTEAANNRLANLQRRINALNRYSISNRRLEDASRPVSMQVTRTAVPRFTDKASERNGVDVWLEKAHQVMSIVVTNLVELDQLMAQLLDCQKELQPVEAERLASIKMHGPSSEKNFGKYRRMRSDILSRAQLIKDIRPLLCSFEKYITRMEALLKETANKGDEIELTEMWNHIRFLLETLSRDEYTHWLKTVTMRQQFEQIRTQMEDRARMIQEASETSRIAAETADLLAYKKGLIDHAVTGWDDFNNNIALIEDIDKKISVNILDFQREQNDALNEQYDKKKYDGEQLRDATMKLYDLNDQLKKEQSRENVLSVLMIIITEMDTTDRNLQRDFNDNLISLRKCYGDQLEMLRSMVDERFTSMEEYVNDLSLVGEDGLLLAASILDSK